MLDVNPPPLPTPHTSCGREVDGGRYTPRHLRPRLSSADPSRPVFQRNFTTVPQEMWSENTGTFPQPGRSPPRHPTSCHHSIMVPRPLPLAPSDPGSTATAGCPLHPAHGPAPRPARPPAHPHRAAPLGAWAAPIDRRAEGSRRLPRVAGRVGAGRGAAVAARGGPAPRPWHALPSWVAATFERASWQGTPRALGRDGMGVSRRVACHRPAPPMRTRTPRAPASRLNSRAPAVRAQDGRTCSARWTCTRRTPRSSARPTARAAPRAHLHVAA